MPDAMRDALVRFLDALEAVAAEHEELFDTDVREDMAMAIEERLVKKSEQGDVPDEFAMFSSEGNGLVRAAVMSYLAEVMPLADEVLGWVPGLCCRRQPHSS